MAINFRRLSVVGLPSVLALLLILRSAAGQPTGLGPSDQADLPAVPVGISDYDVELFGRFAWLWRRSDGTSVVQCEGDFSLHMGPRRLSSRDAVIWIRSDKWRGQTYQTLEVFLWGDARVVEPGGTVSTGPMLLVTLRSFGRLQLNTDATSSESAEGSALYGRALQVRESMVSPAPERPSPPGPVAVLPADRPREKRPRVRRPVGFTADRLRVSSYEGRPVAIATGDVYVWQGSASSADFMDIRAQSAVVFLTEQATQPLRDALGDGPQERQPSPAAAGGPGGFMSSEQRQRIEQMVTGVYLEGDVVLARGERMMRASELYYDFENDRALILDAVTRIIEPTRNLPIYIRAQQIRQLSATEYEARKAKISTSEFYTPHYHVGAERIEFTDYTPRDERGEIVGLEAGEYRIHHGTLAVESVPVLYWPYTAGQFKRGEMALRRVRVGYRDDFGVVAQTKWHLFSLLGSQESEGFDTSLHADYFSDRGPAVGIDSDYQREDYYGLVRSYYVRDRGKDVLSRRRIVDPPHEDRGRALLRHRHILPKGWELTTEISYISDPTFLEEYFESEFQEGKEQETLLYLKKQQDNWAVTGLAKWRILDFLTQTEHLPDVEFRWLGQPLGNWGALFTEARLGAVRYRTDDRRLFDSWRFDNLGRTDITARGDVRGELDFPLSIGPLRLMPFASARGSYWDEAPGVDGAAWRGFFTYGLHGSMYFWRVFDDVESRLLDLHRLRHEIKPDVHLFFSHSNLASSELTPFDPGIADLNVENLDEFDGFQVGFRQRLQTKRGGPGERRTVDWLTFDLEVGFFNDAPRAARTHGEIFYTRPENSIVRNFVNGNLIWRPSDSTALLYDFNWDLNDCQMDIQNISFAVERSPRLSYFVGWRMIKPTDSNLLGFGANYRINQKHTFAVREFFDIDRGRTEEFAITYLRKFPRLYVAITFELDAVEDESIISVAVWPEGLPEATIGSRRYTGLATSTGIRP